MGRDPMETLGADQILATLQSYAPALTHSDMLCLNDYPLLLKALHEMTAKQGKEASVGRGKADIMTRDTVDKISRDEEKIANLRLSLSSLTTHLEQISTRLNESESLLSSLSFRHRKELAGVEEEGEGWKALAVVWQARWREERRVREESIGGDLNIKSGKILNDRYSRLETGMSTQRSLPVPPVIQSHSRHSSSASSSSSNASDTTHRVTTSFSPKKTPSRNPTYSPPPIHTPRLRTRQIVADLSRELERVRRDADRLLFERDEEIARLESDQSSRRREMAELYNSLDTFLGFGGSAAFNQSMDSSHVTNLQARSLHRTTSSLEVSTRGNTSMRKPARSSNPEARTAELEAEVRALELEVERMAMAGNSTAQSGGHRSNVELDSFTQERQGLTSTIQDLNSQVLYLRTELREVSKERETLERLYDRHMVNVGSSSDSSSHSRCTERIQELESSKNLLTSQLTTNESQLSALSARVHSKLLEQKNKLQAARLKITSLQEHLTHEQERRRVLEGLLGREDGTGGRDGRAEDRDKERVDRRRRGVSKQSEIDNQDQQMDRPKSVPLLDAFS